MRFRHGSVAHDTRSILWIVQLLDCYLLDDDRFLHRDFQWQLDQNRHRSEHLSDVGVLLYITMGKITDATKRVTAPILEGGHGSHGDGSHGDGHGDHAAHGEHVAQVSFDQHVVGDQVATVAHEQTGHGDTGERLHDSVEQAHADLSEASHSAVEHAHEAAEVIYSNPLPSVLMLTAIVVGIATTALALALIVRIREDYGSIEEDEILELDKELQ